MSFEWQTDEDYSWDEELETPEPRKPERRRWPWLVLVGVLLVGTAVFLLYRQLNQRVQIATGNVEADLAASYAVLQQAAQNRDENLFSGLLSGRDPEWAIAQRNNLLAGLMFDRPGFNLAWQPVLAETAVFTQTLSPDLTEAELTTIQNYSLNIGNGLTETVRLERLDVYRLGEDRWLYAPPELPFWGIRRRLDGQLLSVRYPARDEAIVQRLAADLEARLVQLCTTSGMDCPANPRVRLIFSPEPATLAQATFLDALTQDRETVGAVWSGQQAVVLPTPSLVGLPQDEVSYRAILRGYAVQLLTVALNDLSGWACCQNVPFYRAWVTYQLYVLGVAEWPLLDTAVSLPPDLNLRDVIADWNADFPENPTEFAHMPMPTLFIDFLIYDLHIPPAQIGKTLANGENRQFYQWLSALAGPSWTEATLSQAFRLYLVQRLHLPVTTARPTEDLLLLCRSQAQGAVGIYHFGLEEAAPQLLRSLGNADAFMVGLPDGSGVAVAARTGSAQPETYLLRSGERVDVLWDDVEGITSQPPLAIPTAAGGNGRYLLWTVTPGFATGTFYALTDLEACQPGGSCKAVQIGGYPIWSPNAERLITLTTTSPWWSEGRANGLMLLRASPTSEAINSPGFGSSVFWRNNEEFGYLAQFQNGQQQLVLTDDSLGRPEILLDNERLRLLFPERERPSSLRIQLVQPLPDNPEIFFILADAWLSNNTPGYMLLYDSAQGIITLLTPLGSVIPDEGNGIRLSPDGRFLQVSLAGPEEDVAQFYLFELTNSVLPPQIVAYSLLGQTPYPRHFYASWSPDGEWLAMPEQGYVRLWQDGLDEQLLSFPDLTCTNAAWVDRMEP